MNAEISLRDARLEDASFVAWTILTAMGMDEALVAQMTPICERDDTLYSWRRARIAELGGCVAGCLISYPGDEYLSCRNRTWRYFRPFEDDELADFDLETFPGEYYLDSLSVKPEFRGRGVGRSLLLDGVAKGRSLGFSEITLIAEQDHPQLVRHYSNIGFRRFGELEFFGNYYFRMRWEA